jgi:L-alanine-DL-glutamate epimerase-like enolase superfamily enzyme
MGHKGYGEAPPITYYNITIDKMIEDLRTKNIALSRNSPFSRAGPLLALPASSYSQKPFLVCALDMAAWDIYGKMKRKKLYEIWNG